MTTREENLKKINEELEKLDDEQLEKVAGGIVFIDSHKSGNPNDPHNQKFETSKSYRAFLQDV